MHFLRNAHDHLPRKAGDDCLQELRWIYERADLNEARMDLAAWLERWERRYPKLTDWARRSVERFFNYCTHSASHFAGRMRGSESRSHVPREQAGDHSPSWAKWQR